MKISSHNEWDPLKEVIVGTAEGSQAVLTWPTSGSVPTSVANSALALAKGGCPQWYLDEVAEDLEGLCGIFKKYGATVRRPQTPDLSTIFSTPNWSATGNNIYNVRDLHLVVGNTVVESASPTRARLFEQSALYDIWYDYFDEGFRWITAPTPRLMGDHILPYFRDDQARELSREDVLYKNLTGGRVEELHKLTEGEILFDAANTARMGRDLLYLVSSSGNQIGAKWLQSVLGDEYKVHTTKDIYRSSHIDSTVLCLRPGLVLLNSARVTEKNCPSIFDSWDKIYFEDVAPLPDWELEFQKTVRDPLAKKISDLGFESNLAEIASPWVGMNLFSLDPDTVIVDARQEKLIPVLESYKLNVIPISMRHMNTQLGGLHCCTLDTVRGGNLESYFD